MNNRNFSRLLANGRPVVIDGGLATQLEAQGCDIDNPLWSASVVNNDPQAIVDAHRAFLDAGAQIIISASYQTIDEQLIAAATDLAIRARDEFVAANGRVEKPLVAASIGPYGAVQSDGSEYTGKYDTGRAELAEFHRARLQQLDASDADLLACETVPSIDEAAALCDLLETSSTPAWISFCCRNGEQISDGTAIEDVVSPFRNHPTVQAIGVNCTSPQFVLPLIERIKATVPDMAVIVYPNSGEVFQPRSKTWSGTETAQDWKTAARKWRDAGARVIGGCCRTGPAQIRAVRDAMQS